MKCIVSPAQIPDTAFHITEAIRSFCYYRLVAQGSTMVATFLLPPPHPPDTLGGAPLASIPEGHVYIETLKNCSAPQGASLGGKFSHRGGDTTMVQDNKTTKTMTPTLSPTI
jgi:hypothetical protein